MSEIQFGLYGKFAFQESMTPNAPSLINCALIGPILNQESRKIEIEFDVSKLKGGMDTLEWRGFEVYSESPSSISEDSNQGNNIDDFILQLTTEADLAMKTSVNNQVPTGSLTKRNDIMIRYLNLRRNTHRLSSRFQQPYFPCAGLGHIGKERTFRVTTTRGLPYQANGLLYPGRLLMSPPLEECLTGLTGSSTRAGTGCTDLQLICGSATLAWQRS